MLRRKYYERVFFAVDFSGASELEVIPDDIALSAARTVRNSIKRDDDLNVFFKSSDTIERKRAINIKQQ